MTDHITDKVVVITGASSGIGEATAKLLASKGAKVVLGARREDKLQQIVDAIEKDGGHAVYQQLDVTKPSEWPPSWSSPRPRLVTSTSFSSMPG